MARFHSLGLSNIHIYISHIYVYISLSTWLWTNQLMSLNLSLSFLIQRQRCWAQRFAVKMSKVIFVKPLEQSRRDWHTEEPCWLVTVSIYQEFSSALTSWSIWRLTSFLPAALLAPPLSTPSVFQKGGKDCQRSWDLSAPCAFSNQAWKFKNYLK